MFAGTERVRQGDFGHRIPVLANDQLGELANSFNQMTGSIEDPAAPGGREAAPRGRDAPRPRDSDVAAAARPAAGARSDDQRAVRAGQRG
ncbi:MAG: HAMP domain-containing protein, partial [Comamonadaceae bacterium]|nr:HAMP domain-containing protein [Comamonadaceae bacterium]